MERTGLEPRRRWVYRTGALALAGGAWWLALSANLGLLEALVSVGLGVAAVLLIPIETIWVRWLFNALVLLVPVLAAINVLIDLA